MTKKEIEKLAKDYGDKSWQNDAEKSYKEGYIDGQYQAQKDLKEQLRLAFESGRKFERKNLDFGIGVEEVDVYNYTTFEDYFNSLNTEE